MSEPLRFYKFKKINKRLIESIVSRSIFASSPESLNDPFDCQIDLGKLFERAISLAPVEKLSLIKSFYENTSFLDNWKKQISSKGIYSFSRINSEVLFEPLMWSHYADEHRGVCLEYILPKEFIVENLIGEGLDNSMILCGSVDYQDNEFVNCILEAPQNIDGFTTALVRKYLLTKSPSWHYEKEGRLVMWKSGSIKLPSNALHRVYFGLRSSPSDVELITELARNYSGCNSFYRVIKGSGDYTLSTEEIVA